MHNKSGTKLNEASFRDWWSNVIFNRSANYFDPRIAYDHHEGRWIMVILYRHTTNKESKLLLSVSQSSDPTGDWWNWVLEGTLTVNGSETWADYPDVGYAGIPGGSGGAVFRGSEYSL